MANYCADTTKSGARQGVWLIYGGTGWIGSQLIELLRKLRDGEERSVESCVDDWPSEAPIREIISGRSRLENRESLVKEIDSIRPDYVINCAGLTGRPNVDWCESHRTEVIRVNIIGTLNLIDVCSSRGIHVTNYATGCIYEYDESHPISSGIGFTEEDEPNFRGSFYSHTKAMMDDLVRNYDNLLTLRLRMPISDDLSPRSFITKITRYEKVINIPNSMTILSDLLPVGIHMAMRKRTGVYNFTNPGTLSHNQILNLYIRYVDPSFTYSNFTVEEQDLILKARRSNNELDVSKLCAEYPNIPKAIDSIEGVMQRIAAAKNNE